MDAKSRKDHNDVQKKWLGWCRLCAKQELNGLENSSIFVENETGKLCSDLATSIGKYFWVNIKPDDEIPRCLCLECKQLVEKLVTFTERVNKVQTLFRLLQNIKPTSIDQAEKLRSDCGLDDEGWQHVIRAEVPVSPKATLVDQEIQTDMITFTTKEQKLHEEVKKSAERKDITNVLQKPDKSPEYESQTDKSPEYESQTDKNAEYESQTETTAGHVEIFEYDIQDHEMEFLENSEYIAPPLGDEDVKQITTESHENMQDSDLFKELKYKIDEDDDEAEEEKEKDAKNFTIISEMEEVEVGYEESLGQEDEEDIEDSIEMLEEEDEEDYLSVNENQAETKVEFLKRKRGRPFGSKNYEKNSPYRFECKECKRRYKNPNIFRKHMDSKHNIVVDNLPDFKVNSNICTLCKKQFVTRGSLKLHMRHHLPDEEKYNVPCPYCDRRFSQVGAMRQHVNGIHHQMKPYICDQCGRACKTMAALTEHQLVHTNECPFECEVCHKRFKNKARLKAHMDIHDKSLYKCADCGLELNTKRTLLQHRLVHSDFKRYKCEFCDAAFKRSKAFKNHLILHSGLRPYKCNFCSKSFSNGSNCRAHKRRTHPVELAEEDANGKEPERVPIPKLEELKSVKGVLVQPRKVKRHSGGRYRKASDSSEKYNQENSNDYEDEEIYESYADLQYEICKSEIDETESLVDNPSEECEETVIYEIIDEI